MHQDMYEWPQIKVDALNNLAGILLAAKMLLGYWSTLPGHETMTVDADFMPTLSADNIQHADPDQATDHCLYCVPSLVLIFDQSSVGLRKSNRGPSYFFRAWKIQFPTPTRAITASTTLQ